MAMGMSETISKLNTITCNATCYAKGGFGTQSMHQLIPSVANRAQGQEASTPRSANKIRKGIRFMFRQPICGMMIGFMFKPNDVGFMFKLPLMEPEKAF